MEQSRYLTHSLLLGIALTSGLTAQSQAQIVPDATLPSRSVVERTDVGTGTGTDTGTGAADRITGGSRSGGNLFHSFREFSVPTGGAAWFDNPLDIDRIFARVTGSAASSIDGLIRANGSASLFLLNPNGILFGPNARLDIGGSFVGSTASAIRFSDGFQFAATDTSTPLLTVSAPVGLRLAQTGPIRLTGPGNPSAIPADPGLAVQPGRSLALVGNGLTLDGAVVTAGRIDLASLAEGEVSLTPTANGFRLGYMGRTADITLQNRATLWSPALVEVPLARTSQGGIHLLGRNIRLNNAQLAAAAVAQADAGDITIQASESLQIRGFNPYDPTVFAPPGSWIVNQVLPNASGDSGDIQISTPRLRMAESGRIQTLTLGSGASGDIRIDSERVKLDGRTAALANPQIFDRNSQISTFTGATGTGGNLFVQADRLLMQNGSSLGTYVGPEGSSSAGNIRIRANQITALGFDAFTGATGGVMASTAGSGNGGNISIATGRLRLGGGSVVSTYVISSGGSQVAPSGDAGDLLIWARDLVELDEANLAIPDQTTLISSITFGSGDGGNINLTTRRLRVLNGNSVGTGVVRSAAFLGAPLPNAGTGDGGDLRVTADQIEVTGVNPLLGTPSNIGSYTFGTGQAGAVAINASQLAVRDGGSVGSTAHQQGGAGRITVNAGRITVAGRAATGRGATLGAAAIILDEASRQAYFLPPFPTGNTGEIAINAARLEVANGGEISARHEGQGNAGQLRINADQTRLNGGQIVAATVTGQGGNVQIQSGQILARQQGQISAEAGGRGNSGNVAITAPLIVATDNSDIIANAQQGRGGTIQIATQAILGAQFRPELTLDSDITASSELGAEFSGTVELRTPDVKPGAEVVELPATVLDPTTQISTACVAANNRFVVTGRGGLPADPNHDPATGTSWADLRDLSQFRQAAQAGYAEPTAEASQAAQLVEASSWRINAAGQRELVATAGQARLPNAGCTAGFRP